MHLQFKIDHLRLETFVAAALSRLRKVDRSEGFECATLDFFVLVSVVWILAEEDDFVSYECAGEE